MTRVCTRQGATRDRTAREPAQVRFRICSCQDGGRGWACRHEVLLKMRALESAECVGDRMQASDGTARELAQTQGLREGLRMAA